ncbi:uncharacterized protein prob1 isoform X1 [Xyrichtys novacula]|uniref:Uncharacterized protein prob1 isoform X1 n=1 Tax=Xyrichtys novacula TaxID=13765 RepID=A0AAV1FR21_XYRNO|nr:uncharacterized protein prob1 isoform X1 [Xyrichtys novacula]
MFTSDPPGEFQVLSSDKEGEEEGSISDWSEEDLSLHFSPSVILQSDDDHSDPESGFECIDITMETEVRGQEGEGLKMVPKRQIQLKRKKDTHNEKHQVKLNNTPTEGGGAISEVHHGPDLLRRQHSLPASLHTTSSDVISYGVYKGLVAGVQGLDVGGTSRQRLQKSFSLDETKTKMATCIIKSILSKKMQVEKNTCPKKPAKLPTIPCSVEQEGVGEAGGKKDGGVSKGPVHVVRDMRKLVKDPYNLTFGTPGGNKPTSFKVIGQEESPPPTYQQAVGVKGHSDTKRGSMSCRGHVAKVAASLSQSQNRNQSEVCSHPITQQRRGSEPIISRSWKNDVTRLAPPTNPPIRSGPTELSQSGKAEVGRHHTEAPPPPFSFPGPAPILPQTPPSAQDQASILDLSSQFVPQSTQQIFKPCFYPAPLLPVYPPLLYPHLGKVSYLNPRLSLTQTPLQHPSHQLGLRTEETSLPDTTSDHLSIPEHTWTSEVRGGSVVTAADQEQQEQHGQQQHQRQQLQRQQLQQPQYFYSLQGLLPAQVGGDFVVDVTGSTTAGALLSGPAPCNILFDPRSGRCFYVDPPPTAQRKMLLDPETGQYVHVLLPAASSAPISSIFPVHSANPTPILVNPAHSALNSAPTVVSVMQLQPTVAVSSCSRPPVHLHMPSMNSP